MSVISKHRSFLKRRSIFTSHIRGSPWWQRTCSGQVRRWPPRPWRFASPLTWYWEDGGRPRTGCSLARSTCPSKYHPTKLKHEHKGSSKIINIIMLGWEGGSETIVSFFGGKLTINLDHRHGDMENIYLVNYGRANGSKTLFQLLISITTAWKISALSLFNPATGHIRLIGSQHLCA